MKCGCIKKEYYDCFIKTAGSDKLPTISARSAELLNPFAESDANIRIIIFYSHIIKQFFYHSIFIREAHLPSQ